MQTRTHLSKICQGEKIYQKFFQPRYSLMFKEKKERKGKKLRKEKEREKVNHFNC